MRKDYKNIYFIGIGGIGMSAIARYFKFKGYGVSGYDRTRSELCAELESEGIDIHYCPDPKLVPSDPLSTLVVYTPAIPSEMEELVYIKEHGYDLLKRSQVLGEISNACRCLAVAGTHGKTTTSTLIAHILTESGEGCSAFLGGISKNYKTNLLMSHNASVVVEADEFDRSFHQLHPTISAITAMDADHLDIYGDLEHVYEAFRIYASQISETIILKYGLPIKPDCTEAKIFTYHFDKPESDFHSTNLRLDSLGFYSYDLVYPGGVLNDIKVGAIGWVNVENSIAAAAVCLCYGIDGQKVRNAIASFQGVKRRLELHVNSPTLSYIDDYAHHPEELSAAITSIRGVFPGRKITGVFQPHLYSRTRDFADEFASALSLLDKLILLDIYPAREEPIEGVSSELILDKVQCAEKILIRKEELLSYLENEQIDVLATFGAGNIDNYIEAISKMLTERLTKV